MGKFGENAVLTCKCEPQAVAKETCQVKWRKDGVDANSRARVSVKDDFNCKLFCQKSFFVHGSEVLEHIMVGQPRFTPARGVSPERVNYFEKKKKILFSFSQSETHLLV